MSKQTQKSAIEKSPKDEESDFMWTFSVLRFDCRLPQLLMSCINLIGEAFYLGGEFVDMKLFSTICVFQFPALLIKSYEVK